MRVASCGTEWWRHIGQVGCCVISYEFVASESTRVYVPLWWYVRQTPGLSPVVASAVCTAYRALVVLHTWCHVMDIYKYTCMGEKWDADCHELVVILVVRNSWYLGVLFLRK